MTIVIAVVVRRMQFSIIWKRKQCVVVVVGFARGFHCVPLVLSVRGVSCLLCCCWFGWRRRVARGCGSCWLEVSVVHEIVFHGFPFQAVLCYSLVVCEVLVFAVCFNWLQAGVDVGFPSVGLSPAFSVPVKQRALAHLVCPCRLVAHEGSLSTS